MINEIIHAWDQKIKKNSHLSVKISWHRLYFERSYKL